MIYAILLAAGSGHRTTLPYNKILHYIGNQTIVEHSLDVLLASGVQKIIVVARDCDHNTIQEILKKYDTINHPPTTAESPLFSIISGGDTRQKSVQNALQSIVDYDQNDIVLIHDSARPFIEIDAVKAVIKSTKQNGSGIAAIPTTDTIAIVKDNEIIHTPPRNTLFNLATPQGFTLSKIKLAYDLASKNKQSFTDDSGIYSNAGFVPLIVPSNSTNQKVTTLDDIYRVSTSSSIGVGFDVHELVANRKLILGGVIIPYSLGLQGHSDADVLTHAIMDSILSANGLGDIGTQFPDTDPQYKDSDSIQLLTQVLQKIDKKIQFVSAVIIAQQPKLSSHILAIEQNLAKAMGINHQCIKISSTTTEGLGIVGQNKGIASSAVVLCGQSFK